jgi:regulator of protease activity HflC (stomatin/prohibitin superfamily)
MRGFFKKIHHAVLGWLRKHRIPIYISTFILLFLVAYFFNRIFIVVPAGHKAVLFKTFIGGTVVTKAYGEGLTVLFPWDRLYIYDTRIQESTFDVSVLSTNGLTLSVRLSVRYYPIPDSVGALHKAVGQDYAKRIIKPMVTEAAREIVGGHKPEELYSTQRHALAMKIEDETNRELKEFPIVLHGVVVESVQLPASINQAIEEKITQQQLQLAYKYILRRAEQEIERKRLEAEGIKKYNQTINSSLSKPMLTWLGIQATKELAESNNAKILLFGGKNGLPVILNLDGERKNNITEGGESGPLGEKTADSPALDKAETITRMGDASPIPTTIRPTQKLPPQTLSPSARPGADAQPQPASP